MWHSVENGQAQGYMTQTVFSKLLQEGRRHSAWHLNEDAGCLGVFLSLSHSLSGPLHAGPLIVNQLLYRLSVQLLDRDTPVLSPDMMSFPRYLVGQQAPDSGGSDQLEKRELSV